MKKKRNTNIIGKKLKLYRENKNWSYEDLSKKLKEINVNIEPKNLENIEMGIRKVTVNEFAGLSECLGVMMDDLINDECKKEKVYK